MAISWYLDISNKFNTIPNAYFSEMNKQSLWLQIARICLQMENL